MFASIVILALFLGGSSRLLAASTAGAAPVFPVKPSANGRYLADQNGAPFFIQGDSPWDLMVQLTKSDTERYLEDRRQKGYTAIIAELMEKKYSDNPPYNKEGNAPFTTPGDFSTPNEAYFVHIDWVLSKAAEKGILVFLFPCFLGYDAGTDGWWAEVNANGATKCRNYGRYLGNRYKSFKNVIWIHGGDYSPPPGSAGESYVLEILLGIKDSDPTKLHTFHGRRYTTALDQAAFTSYMDLDAVYPGDDLAKAQPGDPYQGSLKAYHRTNFKPHFLIEARYESVSGADEGGTYTADRGRLRRQAYWANLSGSTGHFFGNHPVWPLRPGWDGPRGIGSPGNQDMERLRPVFASRAWHTLLPDQNHTVVTAGYGVFGQSDYVTAGRTGDGSLVMAYVPPTGTEKRTLTVDMTRLSGRVEAKWFNPANGAYKTVAGSPFENSGSRNLTTPGDNGTGTNDWVLVLEIAPSSFTPTDATKGRSGGARAVP